MSKISSSQICNYKKKLRNYYLLPGRDQAKSLENFQPKTISPQDGNGKILVRMPSGILYKTDQEEIITIPEVYIQTLVEDYWKLFELALTQLDSPLVAMTLRTIFEQCYKKILYFSNCSKSTQTKIAIKSWALTSASMVRRAHDLTYLDEAQVEQFQRWLGKLPEPEKSKYLKIQTDHFSSGAISKEIGYLYPGLYKVLKENLHCLVNADGTPRGEYDGLVIISNDLNGYVHGNSAYVSDMINGLQDKHFAYRSRTILCVTAYQVMSLINEKWLHDQKIPLKDQATYFKRMSPQLLKRLSRSD